MNDSIEPKLRSILKSELGIDTSVLGPDDLLLDGKIIFDSITSLRLVVAIEDAFNIIIDDDDINDELFYSMNNMIDLIKRYQIKSD